MVDIPKTAPARTARKQDLDAANTDACEPAMPKTARQQTLDPPGDEVTRPDRETQQRARSRASSTEGNVRSRIDANVPASSSDGMARLREKHPLAIGDDAPEVKGDIQELQQKLKDEGLYKGEITGSFDAATRDAVKAFQRRHNLKVDGVVGQQTWGALLGVKVDPGLKLLKPWARSFHHAGGTGSVAEGPRAEELRAKALRMHGPQFMAKLEQVAQRLGVTPDAMLAVMNSESGLRTDAVNPNGGATGLIQFMPQTAKGLGTSTAALKNMSAVEQLDYVEKYYRPYAGKLHNATDLYTVTFWPAALGKPDSYVVGGNNAGMIARANPIFDIDHDGAITMANFREFCRRKFHGL